MAGYETERISSAALGVFRPRADGNDARANDSSVPTKVVTMSKFRQFLTTWSKDNTTYPYRQELKANWDEGNYQLTVDCDDLTHFDASLFNHFLERPAECLPDFEDAAAAVVESLTPASGTPFDKKHIQLMFRNLRRDTSLRVLSATDVSKLVSVSGIVVSAGRPKLKATVLSIMCRNCRQTKTIACGAGFGGAHLPPFCDTAHLPETKLAKCPRDPYIILPDSSHYIDQQRMKLQESPESVPTGEMPRQLLLSLDRYLVGAVKPGTRITVVGVYTTLETKAASQEGARGVKDVGIRLPYLRALGIQQDNEATELLMGKFTPEDEEEMHAISQLPDLYERIASSIAPAIFGAEDIKRALACQLFGGARKHLPDSMRLRGDINVLLLGDPSVAKSQFLKFIIQVAPIGVYTSGKGNSAAGLTASVLRDAATGEFHLEGGAMVLADGGLVCIDEFDKMREEDRVAIHEAMEQQTISIAKAGITTILNSRTSILAAANPIYGRYDDFKTPTENIDFQTTILSRFDLIFIVRDLQDEAKDTAMAKHIVSVHAGRDASKEAKGAIPIDKLKKYIAYCRQRIDPRLSEEAAESLMNEYVEFRKEMRKQTAESGKAAIPITVRQLEAIIRISESRARMDMQTTASIQHVKEALRLFKVSTMQAAHSTIGDNNGRSSDGAVQKAEKFMNDRVPIGTTISTEKLRQEMVRKGYDQSKNTQIWDEGAVMRAFMNEVHQ